MAAIRAVLGEPLNVMVTLVSSTLLNAAEGMSAVAKARKVGSAAPPLLGPAKRVLTDWVTSAPISVPLVVTGEPDTAINVGKANATDVTVPALVDGCDGGPTCKSSRET